MRSSSSARCCTGAGWIYDVANARATVRDYNRAHGSLSAMLVPTGNGVALAGTF